MLHGWRGRTYPDMGLDASLQLADGPVPEPTALKVESWWRSEGCNHLAVCIQQRSDVERTSKENEREQAAVE